MKKTYKIGWQKYEDVIESQINSPIVDQIYNSLVKKSEDAVIENLTEEELQQVEEILRENPDMIANEEVQMMNITESLANEISLATNFDCWIGHTNFNLTEQLKDQLDNIEGVEMLKIYSRYRFLVGVGRMFDFSEVRKNIEKLIKKD